MSNSPVRAADVAKDLERRIRENEFAPHERLPTVAALAEEYRTAQNTAHAAVKILARKGLVTSVRSYGTIVSDWRRPRQIRRKRAVYADERGYYFDMLAKEWNATEPSRIAWEPVATHLADLLGIEEGAEVLIRQRLVGDIIELAPGRKHLSPQQVSTTVIPADIARPLKLDRKDTGMTGALGLLEKWLQEDAKDPEKRLHFEDVTYARFPTEAETAALQLGADVPALGIAVLVVDPRPGGRVLAVNDYVMDGRRWMVGHSLTRTASARGNGK
jgi:GntR family transcriptional regulator